jgi:hypothetical protein
MGKQRGTLARAGAQRFGAHGKCTGDQGNLLGWVVVLYRCEAEEAGRGMTGGVHLAVMQGEGSGVLGV